MILGVIPKIVILFLLLQVPIIWSLVFFCVGMSILVGAVGGLNQIDQVNVTAIFSQQISVTIHYNVYANCNSHITINDNPSLLNSLMHSLTW